MSPGRLPRDLDPALPDLDRALDPSHVARRFERRWPGPDRPSVVACIAQQRRWAPGVGCVATYQLALAGGSGHGESTIGVVTVDPEGVRHRLFSDDEELGGIAAAKSEEAVGGWLAERLRLPVGSWSVTPVRYWPGARCVFRYAPAR